MKLLLDQSLTHKTPDTLENAGPYYLGLQERIIIADRLHAGKSIRAIAGELSRAPSTISREVNKHRSPITGDYQPYHADQQVVQARKRPKPAKINRSALLFQLVEDGLKKHWSPEQISGWLKKNYPDNPAMNMRVETIYQAMYVHARGQLKLEVKKMLRTGRSRRKPHKQPQQRTPRFK
ncbi:transposase, partial [Corynebacterium belfantii]|uniref:transposase n=2 Tax=Corynebacterium belfantii TaxID=2014537 RepID=UPI0039EFAD77